MRPLSFTKPSTNVSKAEFDSKTGILTVAFDSGSTYRYANVTEEMVAAWEKAESVGKWFNKEIKSKAKEFPVIRDDEKPDPAAAAPTSDAPAELEQHAAAAAKSDEPSTIDYRSVDIDVLLEAKRSYEDYAANSHGKTFDGRAMPTWQELLEKKSPVVSHWCAVAIGARKRLSSDSSEALALERNNNARLSQKVRELEDRNVKLGRHAGQADANAVEAAARERTKTLEDEVDKLREEKTALEAELAKKPRPERPWQKHERG